MIAADSTCSLMIKTSQEHTLELLAKKTKQKNEQRKNVVSSYFWEQESLVTQGQWLLFSAMLFGC